MLNQIVKNRLNYDIKFIRKPIIRCFSSNVLLENNAVTRKTYTNSTNSNNNHPELNHHSHPNTEDHQTNSFTKEFLNNHIQLTNTQRLILSVGSSIASLLDPHRHDMIACLGETTGNNALKKILQQMQSDSEGLAILKQKPRINSMEIDLNQLGQLPNTTFGYYYKKFLDDNKVTPDSRMEVRFLDDPELAYVMQRYRECHDLVHTILGMPTNMLGEVTVKWVEALNIGLPMCYGGAIFGVMRLRPKQRKLYKEKYLPWALNAGANIKPLMSVYWEKRWEQNIDDLRNELNIKILNVE